MSLYSESSSATSNEINAAAQANIQQRLDRISDIRAHSDYVQPIMLSAVVSMLEAENSVIRARMRTVSDRDNFLTAADGLEQAQKGVAANEMAAESDLRRGVAASGPLAYAKHYLKEWKRLDALRNPTAKAYRKSTADLATEWVKLLSSRKHAKDCSVPVADPALNEASRFCGSPESRFFDRDT